MRLRKPRKGRLDRDSMFAERLFFCFSGKTEAFCNCSFLFVHVVVFITSLLAPVAFPSVVHLRLLLFSVVVFSCVVYLRLYLAYFCDVCRYRCLNSMSEFLIYF